MAGDPLPIGRKSFCTRLLDLKALYPFLRDVHSQPLQQTLNDLVKAYERTFDPKLAAEPPTIKKKQNAQGIRFPQGFRVENKRVYLPKIGRIGFRCSKRTMKRKLDGKIKNVTVKLGSFTSELKKFEDTILTGMAPACTLLSYRVLDDAGVGKASSIIEAITQIRLINDMADSPIVHGVNLSVGYPFDAEWFACGQSPLCVEIDRLVKSGVVVVTAAGNSGYGVVSTSFTGARAEGIGMSINDPGNSELAITVGSMHREKPHTFGMSYFSSKGPTGDGRLKPDLVAPGERIISCASSQCRTAITVVDDSGATQQVAADAYQYREDSGTSMAAPHVSGVIASFLSIRREYIGQPEVVKRLFMDNATDLKRDRNYQGAGLVDPMRVISAI